jgi:hypothetical protein
MFRKIRQNPLAFSKRLFDLLLLCQRGNDAQDGRMETTGKVPARIARVPSPTGAIICSVHAIKLGKATLAYYILHNSNV